MSEAFLALRGLTLAYGETVVVPSLDLSADKGELIALLGPSGCGKTTTMRAIAGLIAPQAGRIAIGGQDVTRVPAHKRGIGLVFQSYALFPHLSAFENVAFGLRLKKLPETEIRQRTLADLETVGLAQLAQRKPEEMSGGQQQRLALARSLVMKPKVLLLDEPLSNLDARLRLEMRAEIQRVQRETGVTTMFVTHDQGEALALADRIALMREGKIEQVGTPEDLYNNPASTFAADFLGFENIFAVDGDRIRGAGGSLPLAFATKADHLSWRPGGIQVGQGPYQGVVESVAFAGKHREYVISTSIGKVKADAPVDAPACSIGESVRFSLPQETAKGLSGST